MMASFKVDTEQLSIMVASLEVVTSDFETRMTSWPDVGESKGETAKALEEIGGQLQKTKEALKHLMEQTCAFLKEVGMTYDESDRNEAINMLQEQGVIKEKRTIS